MEEVQIELEKLEINVVSFDSAFELVKNYCDLNMDYDNPELENYEDLVNEISMHFLNNAPSYKKFLPDEYEGLSFKEMILCMKLYPKR